MYEQHVSQTLYNCSCLLLETILLLSFCSTAQFQTRQHYLTVSISEVLFKTHDRHNFNVAKYHLDKVKLELMQPASVPIQLISFRQVKYELMQPAVSVFGSM